MILLGVFAAVVIGTGYVHTHIPPTTRVDRGEAFVPDPLIAKTLSLGFDAVLADYYWLQAVQAIGGDSWITPELATHIGKLVDLVTTLNPWVDHPYRFAAIWLTESEANVRTANRLLRRGIEHHPDEWRNPFYLGFNHFFYLLENEEAADALERAARLPGSPAYLNRLAARLRSENATIDVAEAMLRQLLGETKDEGVQAGYLAALDEIEIERKAQFLDSAREAFIARHGRDIERVEELAYGPDRVMSELPGAEPDSLPASLARGSVWTLDPESGQITSSYYGNRYQLHFASRERARAEGWAKARVEGDAAAAARAERMNGTNGVDRSHE